MEVTDILELVKADLKKRLGLKKIEDYTEISIEAVTELLEEEGVFIYTDFKQNLTTPWSVARYLLLFSEEKSLIKEVESDLAMIIPDTVETAYLKKFSNIVQITKKFVEGEKKQSLQLKYFKDEDDKLQYKIVASNFGGWDISKSQLGALLRNQGFIPEKFEGKGKKQNWFKRLLKKIGL